MPSTVQSIFSAAGLKPAGVVAWGSTLPIDEPGVYVVALTAEAASSDDALARCPIDPGAIDEILKARPELTLDGERPSAEVLAERLAAFWLPDEVVLYIGLAGTSLAKRVGQYYLTALGARSPHAGGWFLKVLSVLPALHVHYAACINPAKAEGEMLESFRSSVSERARAALHDPERPLPFANLEYPPRIYKRHGIKGAKAARARKQPPDRNQKTPAAPGTGSSPGQHTPQLITQRVTAADLRGGRIRIPRGASKDAFPSERGKIEVEIRGEVMSCRWDPRYGPPERSGVLSVGKAVLAGLVDEGERLRVDASNGLRLS